MATKLARGLSNSSAWQILGVPPRLAQDARGTAAPSGWTQEGLAKKEGKSQQWIARRLPQLNQPYVSDCAVSPSDRPAHS